MPGGGHLFHLSRREEKGIFGKAKLKHSLRYPCFIPSLQEKNPFHISDFRAGICSLFTLKEIWKWLCRSVFKSSEEKI